jgi:hypothetical protein
MDKIEIKITRGCDGSGNGGTVVDNASAVLGLMPDATPIVDVIVAAFSEAYGLHQVEIDGEMQLVSEYRNVSYRLRQHMTEIVSSYAQRQAKEQATQQVQAAVTQALESVVILES